MQELIKQLGITNEYPTTDEHIENQRLVYEKRVKENKDKNVIMRFLPNLPSAFESNHCHDAFNEAIPVTIRAVVKYLDQANDLKDLDNRLKEIKKAIEK